ncbi:hypothetical protein KDW40_01730 [Burkholderia cenocepacia]|uniref:hypothetical protein n=1 Tax=Burkholderia TaxID=32008 RepID=UPI000318991F|nr:MULTISPECIES: hypothetical protein [Burkholderia]MBR8043181.1 hypothetical protein [Burkholderia cenocepacia]MBR8324449.1 hypothetical protein [Burkholderia cenocepacia]
MIENTEMTGSQIIEALHGQELHWSTAEARRTRVSICLLCKNGWLKHRLRNGVAHYRYAKKRKPRPREAIHGQVQPPPASVVRLTEFLTDWVAVAVVANMQEEQRHAETA